MLLTPPARPLTIRPLSNPEFYRLHARNPTLPTSAKRDCITCRDRRTYRLWTDERRVEIGEFACDCKDQWLLNHALTNANLGLAYQRLSWADMTAVESGALDEVGSYLESAEAYVSAGVGLILHGEMGAGKTSLLTLVGKNLMARGFDFYFTTFSEMIDTYTGGWNDKDEKAWFHKRIKNVGVLVMDDVGREYQGRAKSGLPESTFDEVLRHRVAASKPTFISSNKDMTQMQEGYGGNVMSLLHERSTTYRFTGEDFRGQARSRLVEEAKQGLTRPVCLA